MAVVWPAWLKSFMTKVPRAQGRKLAASLMAKTLRTLLTGITVVAPAAAG
jgi:hypothetical protein